MGTGGRIWATTTIKMAGFPIGEIRSVDPENPTIAGFLETGVLVRAHVDGEAVALGSTAAPVSVPAEEEPPVDTEPEPVPEASEEPSEAAPESLFEPVSDPDSSPDTGIEDADVA